MIPDFVLTRPVAEAGNGCVVIAEMLDESSSVDGPDGDRYMRCQ
jgi:hypothetical protein